MNNRAQFLSKYTTPAFASRLIILLSDLGLCAISICLACFLRVNFDLEEGYEILLNVFLPILIIRIITFRLFRTYALIVRYAGFQEVKKILSALLAGSFILVAFNLIFKQTQINSLWKYYGFLLPLSVVIIDFFLSLSFIAAFRIFMPSLFNLFFYERRLKTGVVLFGAGHLGAQITNVIGQDAKNNYSIDAILDDNPDVDKKYLNGVPIYPPSKLKLVVEKYKVKKAIIGIKNISDDRKNQFVDMCLENGLQVLQPPNVKEWIDGGFGVDQIKEIRIEDLLNRHEIFLDKENIASALTGKRIMVTGGAGSIGSELIRQIIPFNPGELVIIDQAESPLVDLSLEIKEEFSFDRFHPIIADVSDILRIKKIFQDKKPQIVFHAAAYKHVPIIENNPREGVSVNIRGSKNVADCADHFGVEKFVLISTDKAVNPTNIMGATKRIAEMYIQSLDQESNTQFITTRFGNVLGSNGSVVPRFKKQIEQKGPVTVTHPDITRYFMTIPEAAQLVLEAGTMGNGGEIFLFDMGEPVKIVDLAEKMIKLSGFRPYDEIDIIFTGLRPGEKLTEELLSTKENSITTHHPKITKAKVREFTFEKVNKDVCTIIDGIDILDDFELATHMKSLLPEFISNNSEFSVLDKPAEVR